MKLPLYRFTALPLLFLMFNLLVKSQNPITCGELPPHSAPPNLQTTFYDRFGNTYSFEDLDKFYYNNHRTLQGCNSGIFDLIFIEIGSVPVWTDDEMTTVCAVFGYLSGLVSTGSLNTSISIRVSKDGGCASSAAGTPIWDAECGIGNSVIFDQINSGESNYPIGFLSGLICIRPTPTANSTWHLLADDDNCPTPPCIATNEGDLYTAVLHEALHVLGFASLISQDGTPLNNVYSRWDRFLHSSIQNDFLINPQPSNICCDNHIFNTVDFPNMPTSLSGGCEQDVFFYDGVNNLAEVNNSGITPTNNNEMLNKLSHLDNNCAPPGTYFVMNPTLSTGTYNRLLSAQELEILCRLGYSSPNCNNDCTVVANNDNDYIIILANSQYVLIPSAELLENDNFSSAEVTVTFCGNDPGINVSFSDGAFIVYGFTEGLFSFCYNVIGCEGWCDEAEVTVLVRQENIPLVCENQDCNLICFGDFEGFYSSVDIQNNYFNQSGLPDFSFDGHGNTPDVYLHLNSSNSNLSKMLHLFQGEGLAHREGVVLPLSEPLQPGCEITVNFDAACYQGAITDPASLMFFGLTDYPAINNETPNCQTSTFVLNTNSLAYCMNEEIFGYPLYIDTDALENPGDEELWQNLNLQPETFSWQNSTNEIITYLLITVSTPQGFQNISHAFIDNLSAYSNCISDFEINLPSEFSEICIDGEGSIDIEICLHGDGVTPINTLVEAGPLFPGLSFNGGDFGTNGVAEITLIPNGDCIHLTLSIEAGSNWLPNTIVEIPIYIAPQIGSCFNPNQNGATAIISLIECSNFICNCPPGSNIYNIGTAVDENILISQLGIPFKSIENSCINILGNLIIDDGTENPMYVSFYNCEVIMQPGSRIIIKDGNSLFVKLGQIHGCPDEPMWRSIVVEPNARLDLSNLTLVADGQHAITVNSNSILGLAGNHFVRNYISLYKGPANTWDGFYLNSFSNNEFHCENETLHPAFDNNIVLPLNGKSYAGISIEDMSGILTLGNASNSNIFHHMNNGIRLRNVNADITNCIFRNINTSNSINQAEQYTKSYGYAIWSLGKGNLLEVSGGGNSIPASPNFESCTNGIYAYGNNTNIHHNNLQKVLNGIIVQKGDHSDIDIAKNKIACDLYGVKIDECSSANHVYVTENYICIDSLSYTDLGKGTGILVQDAGNPHNNTLLYLNYINMWRENNGIVLQGTHKIYVGENEAWMRNYNLNGSGFLLRDANGSMLECNKTYATSHLGGTTKNMGLTVKTTQDGYYKNNFFSKNRLATNFSGSCLGTNLETNVFNRNYAGIYINNGIIGGQNHKGNEWWIHPVSPPRTAIWTGTPAPSQNIVQDNQFEVDPSDGINLAPTSVTPISGWFQLQSGATPHYDPNNCQTAAIVEDEEESSSLITIAEDDNSANSFELTMDFLAKRYLYAKLDESPELLDIDVILEEFWEDASDGTLGKLYGIEQDKKLLYSLADALRQELEEFNLEIKTYLSQLKVMDGQLPVEPTVEELVAYIAQKEAIYESVNVLKAAKDEILLDLKVERDGAISNILAENNSVPDIEIYETNEKLVTGIYLETVASDNLNISANQIADLEFVAAQCPLTGGPSVYRARSILDFYGYGGFDDEEDCQSAQALIYGNGSAKTPFVENNELEQSKALLKLKSVIKISPNPAAKELFLNFRNISEGIKHFTICNSYGSEVIRLTIGSDQINTPIDISLLSSGFYHCKIIAEDGELLFIEKLVIVK